MGELYGDGDIRLDRTLEACRGKSQKTRNDGMRDLKAFFDRRHKANIDVLTDQSFHKIYEDVFEMAVTELQVFLAAKKSTKGTAEFRLDTCGDVVRTVITAGAAKLRPATVEAVLEHVTQTLPRPSGGYYEPLAQHYLKALIAIFEHQANVEHLKSEVWVQAVEFCLSGIKSYLDDYVQESLSSRSHSGRGSSVPTSSANKHGHSQEGSLNRTHAEDLFQVLHLLLCAPNVPLGTVYSAVGNCITRFLRMSGSNASQTQQVAFSTLNIILRFARTDQTTFCQSAAQDILPVICRFWQGKAIVKDEMLNSVRDEMLIFIFYVHLHLERTLMDGDAPELLSMLEELLEAFKLDYAPRSDRDQLHLSDLDMADFCKRDPRKMPFCLYAFQLRPYNVKAERNWAILRSIGLVERLVSLGQQQVASSETSGHDDLDNRPSKRQRIVHHSDRLFDLLRSKDENLRLAGLQILPFVLQDSQLPASVLSELLTQLHICAIDKRGNMTSWALLAIASCTTQTSAAEIPPSEWAQLWQCGARSLTFSATCRAAALELHAIIARGLVRYHEIAEDVGAIITSADSSGPTVLCDSSIFLMVDLLNTRIREVPGASLITAQHIIRWLFARWNPDDGNFAARYSIHVQPLHVTALLRACLGLPAISILVDTTMPCGSLAQAWEYHLRTQEVVRYLLLLNDKSTDTIVLICPSCPKTLDSREMIYSLSTIHFQTARKLVLELLQPKSRDILQNWKSYVTDRSSLISTDMFRGVLYSCITILLLMPYFVGMTLPQLNELESDRKGLTKEVTSFLTESDAKGSRSLKSHTETMLQSIQPYLPPLDSIAIAQSSRKAQHLLGFFSILADNMSQRHTATANSSLPRDVDFMDIDDDDFDDSKPHGKAGSHRSDMPRQDLALEMWAGSFNLMVTGHLMLVAAMHATPEVEGVVSVSFVDQLVLLNDQQFMSSRWLLRQVLDSDLVLDEDCAYRILERVGELLQSDEYDRCEVALGTCLDALTGLGPLWSMCDDSSVAEAAPQLYRWFIKVFQKNVISPEVQKSIAELLLFLMRANPEYGIAWKKPTASPRSTLFSILQEGTINVKFCIGNQVPQIFDLFILKDHDNVFEDVFTKLPMDPNWLEGISFRLYVLAKLASRWSTLLRRCIYYIFEAPGKMPNCIKHATTCLKEVASCLQVEGPREVFALFAPQLLYTWLGNQKIEDIPFAIFGFPSLKDLVDDAQEEAAALMIMRGQDEHAQKLAKILHIEYGDLIQNCFTKIVAYSVPYDLATPLNQGEIRTSGEKRIKRHIGEEVFRDCLHLHFADIIAILFNIMSSEQSVDKYFLKEQALANAGKIMRQIKDMGISTAELPAPQQPHFKARYLHAEIEHLCKRTGYDVRSLYTPALVVSVARKLLNGMHPALGSLYACSVLRKLRVLISLAGNTAIQGYPLEMLLHSMRQFVTDPECADDAIGITKYLMSAGAADLLQKPTFVAGLALSLSGSLRSTFDSQKASTTQESQHQSTKSKAQSFYAWIGEYLQEYESPALKSQLQPSFKKLVRSAFKSEGIGNADKDSAESEYLIQLLKDEQRGGVLLERPSRSLALSLLSSNFRSPMSFRADILGEDVLSMDYAAVVWKSCRGSSSQAYLSWAARVMGRAFAASGQVHEELLQESTLSQIKELSTSADADRESQSCILSLLRELTLGSSPLNAGLAETALRVIMSHFDGAPHQRHLPESLLVASAWTPYQIPPSDLAQDIEDIKSLAEVLAAGAILEEKWLQDLSIAVARSVPDEPLLQALVPILQKVPGFADRVFPFVVHLAISTIDQDQRPRKDELSQAFVGWFDGSEGIKKNNLKMLLNTILYLRTQPLPHEKSMADRSHWLSIDFLKAATAATQCGMFKTAILFAEEHWSLPIKTSRRSSAVKENEFGDISPEILLNIFENIDDPDMYYGVQQTASLGAILARFDYEKDGTKSLAFRGAQYDSHIRRRNPHSALDVQSLVKALDVLNLSGLSSSLLQAQQSVGMTPAALESMFRTARKLEQWDIPVPSTGTNDSVTTYKTFQAVNMANSGTAIEIAVNEGLETTMKNLVLGELSASALHSSLQTLASLVELDEVFTSRGSPQFEEILSRFKNRSTWMKTGRFDDISQILSCRGTTLSTLNQEPRLQAIMKVQPIDTRIVEVETALLSSTINRAHGALQESLSLATSMIDLIKPCHDVGVSPEVAIHLEAANALWDQGEMGSSIRMLQALDDGQSLRNQTIVVERSDLLTKTGYRVSVARLQPADKVIGKYLRPALKELNGHTAGSLAGQVFHQFAKFCDQQLQDPDSLEDLARLEQLTKNKESDVEELQKLNKAATANEKQNVRRNLNRSMAWLKLDREELGRHKSSRDEFVRQCLENYLLALAAFDEHNSNALRFSALWMEHSDTQLANDAVSKHLNQVPSRKFAPLMNQLTSRLQDTKDHFQTLLFGLVLRICIDHPFHGMYQVYTGSVSTINDKDDSSVSRRSAATKVSRQLEKSKAVNYTWAALQTCNRLYSALAREKDEQRYRSGQRFPVKQSVAATNLNNKFPKLALPPLTMQIPLSLTGDYTKLPTIIRLDQTVRIASGVSAPKIITAIASNGVKFTQLVKGGSDDLRQDAIMEQVFEQVSELLRRNKSTRQRNLRIRTYGVLPLTQDTGVIEFVANTIPLHDFLMPAHEKYHPKDLKPNACRKAITDQHTSAPDIRIKTYRQVTERFHPAMRYFFTEKFTNPDEWFLSRLAYTRSTAAISMLGHVLGLGDRHGHNILLDQRNGEVVHIDLGVAFEMGRVLAVPEIIPFRCSRDIVDGMGITKTEGVFRRCCEFTLETLRKESSTIMAILEVLRYDPLYSWSINPLRQAKIQEDQSAALAQDIGKVYEKKAVNEPGEADRALTVVNKKLSKTLSVTATVNDLINQATDEKHLALLFSGISFQSQDFDSVANFNKKAGRHMHNS
ncbi:related to phosphotidylinositol kinase [Rhynchosporium agropyri]|uniref:Serine/threonine-protein kinase Tel1 n=1 Tax=Rhynchosporium agropyri TaxID=914238 RepID=A0A1E1KY03_9HELO|nr:related to phosphotidylinositol kinase [Rhynchosporium agropyri]